MTDYRSMLERETRRFDPPPDAIGRLHRRRERAHRNRRIAAGVTALLITAAATGALLRAFGSVDRTQPATGPGNLSSWTRLDGDAATANADLRAVVPFGNGFVAVGDTSRADGVAPVWTSPDGVTWTRLPASQAPDSPNLFDLTVGGPGVVAVGVDGRDRPAAWSSADGQTWERAAVELPASGGYADSMFHVEVAGDTLFATGRIVGDAYLWTSRDGRSWSSVPDESVFGGRNPWIGDIATLGDGFVAVGAEDTTEGNAVTAVWTSSDGETWVRASDHDVAVDGDKGNIAFLLPGGPGLVGMAGTGEQWTSSDGVHWTRQPAQTSLDHAAFDAVTPSVDGYLAVGGDHEGGAVWTSVDGLAWTSADTSGSLVSPDQDGNYLSLDAVAVGSNGAVAVGYVNGDHGSSGGIWTTIPVPGASQVPSSTATATEPTATPSPESALYDVVATFDATSLSAGDDLDLDGADAVIDGDQGGRDLTWDGSELDNPIYRPPGAAFVQAIPDANFDAVGGADLAALPWSRETPRSAPGLNPPAEGEVFGVWTNGGNYAKVEVLGIDAQTIRLRAVTYRGVDPPCLVRPYPFDTQTDAHGDSVVRASDRLVVCGTYLFDLDTGTEGADTADLFWERIDDVHAQISAEATGVGLANLGAVDFDSLTRDDLRALDLSANSIDGSADDRNQLAPGNVFAVRTSDGNLAKVQVLRYGYDLELRYVTYAG